MIEERYPEEIRESEDKVQAKVILAKCPYAKSKSENAFGMRIQKHGADWYRTWAFKIDMEKAHNEGYDKEVTAGSFMPDYGYPGCPYCGTDNLAQCSCGKSFCFKKESEYLTREMRITCPWCGKSGIYRTVEKLNLHGGGY